jgi:membrane protein involved in colicin uptake
MSLVDIPLSILRFQYKLVRIPLDLFENNVVQTWSTEAPARLVYERTVGSIDQKVGHILGDKQTQQRGTEQVHHADELARAKRLEAEADAKEAEADQKLKASREAAEKERTAAAKAADEATEKARAEAEQRKKDAAHEAEQKAAADKKRADDLAASRVAAAEDAKAKQQKQIDNAEKVTTAPAEAELADAAAHQEQAEDKKAEADRIEKLFLAQKDSD